MVVHGDFGGVLGGVKGTPCVQAEAFAFGRGPSLATNGSSTTHPVQSIALKVATLPSSGGPGGLEADAEYLQGLAIEKGAI